MPLTSSFSFNEKNGETFDRRKKERTSVQTERKYCPTVTSKKKKMHKILINTRSSVSEVWQEDAWDINNSGRNNQP